ncbi:MAG: hypothetical protein ABFD86_11935, partial [Bryobacteraceae bacterium]
MQVGFRFVSAGSSPVETPSEPLPGVVNIFRGSAASSWQTRVPRYGRVEFGQLYPGVSVAYTVRDGQVICHIMLEPGADLGGVTMEALGVQSISSGTGTSLYLMFSRLVAYSLNGLTASVTDPSGTVSVLARFRLIAGNRFQIELDAPALDSRREVQFAVLSSASHGDFKDVVAGLSDNIYVAGATDALGVGATPDSVTALDPALEICSWTSPMPTACSDAFVAKFDTAGKLAWISYFHGIRDDEITQVKRDSSENIYVTGGTASYDFPVTPGALQPSYGGPTPPFKNDVPTP